MKAEFNSEIRIIVDKKAQHKMDYIVASVPTEVGWLGLTERIDNTIFVKDVYILDQEVTAVTTEIDSEASSKLYKKLVDEGVISIENQETTGLYLWGHSHVNMATNPSGTDNEQFDVFCHKNNSPYFIRLIQNKKGSKNVLLFLNDIPIIKELYIQDVPMEVDTSEYAEVEKVWDEELKDCLRKPTPKVTKITTTGAADSSLFPSWDYPEWGNYSYGYGERNAECYSTSKKVDKKFRKTVKETRNPKPYKYTEDEIAAILGDDFTLDEVADFKKQYPGLYEEFEAGGMTVKDFEDLDKSTKSTD